ncbi:MAG: hypothetical protein ABJB74_16940 [Gemmatimonas sp.]
MNFSASSGMLHRAVVIAASLAICSVSLAAQTNPAPAKPMAMDHGKMEMQEPATGWKELDSFHTLMAASWHPASGKNDLAPAKAKAVDMAKAATVWANSKAPKGCDTPKIKEALAKVNAGAQEFAALVAKGTADAELKTKLGDIHETFEVVEMGCKPEKAPAK